MDLFRLLESFLGEFVARHGAVLQSLWVDEITLKACRRDRGLCPAGPRRAKFWGCWVMHRLGGRGM